MGTQYHVRPGYTQIAVGSRVFSGGDIVLSDADAATYAARIATLEAQGVITGSTPVADPSPQTGGGSGGSGGGGTTSGGGSFDPDTPLSHITLTDATSGTSAVVSLDGGHLVVTEPGQAPVLPGGGGGSNS